MIASHAAQAQCPGGRRARMTRAVGQQDGAAFGKGLLDDRAFQAMRLDQRCQVRSRCTVLLVGRPHHQRRQVPERIDGGMPLGAPTAHVPVATRACPALGRRLHRATVQDRRLSLCLPYRCTAQEHPQVVDTALESCGGHPPVHLLRDPGQGGRSGGSRCQWTAVFARERSPLCDLAQIMLALAHLFGQQRERGRV